MRALKSLHALGWSDSRVAHALNGLPLHCYPQSDRWEQDEIEDIIELAREDGFVPLLPLWTIGQVRYYRRAFKISHKPRRWEGQRKQEHRERVSFLAFRRGWGHLVCRSAEITDAITAGHDSETIAANLGHGWRADMVDAWKQHPWDLLLPTESAILSAMHDAGVPMTRAELITATGSKMSSNGGWDSPRQGPWMSLLQRKRLIEPVGWVWRGNTRPLYGLLAVRYYNGDKTPRIDALLKAMRGHCQ